jgi:hypothetical protein
MTMSAKRKIETLAAVFALAASAWFAGATYEQARDREPANAVLYGAACATFGAAGLIDLARLRRRR